MSTLGVITARGGSKGIPGKNIRLLAGRPLIAYTIESAHASGMFDRVVLSTDDADIAQAARALGCEVPFMRPSELARDDTPHLPVMQHAVSWLQAHEDYRPDSVMILQPTSPLRRAEHIREAVALFRSADADSVVGVSAVPIHYHPLRTLSVDALTGAAKLFVTGEPVATRVNRRQDLPPVWMMNGAIYLFRAGLLFESPPNLYGQRSIAYVMSSSAGISIDEPDDWVNAERALAESLE